MRNIRRFFLFIQVFALSGVLYPIDFQHQPFGTRAIGLSDTSTVLVKGIQSLHNNPAGLDYITASQIYTQYSLLHTGLTDNSSLSGFSIAFAHKHPVLGALAYGLHSFSLVGYYSESIISVSISKKIIPRLYVGASVKPMFQQYTLDDYIRESLGGRNQLLTLGLDQGIIYEITRALHIGFAMLNFNQPNIGLKVQESLPMKIKFGTKYRYEDVDFGVDITHQKNIIRFNVGLEKPFELKNFKFTLRGGLGIGNREYLNIALGTSALYKNIKLEYAFVLPKFYGFGTHFISFSYEFFKPRFVTVEEGIPVEELRALEKERDDLKLRIDMLEEETKKLKSERDKLHSKSIELETKLKTISISDTAAMIKEIEELKSKIKNLESKLLESEITIKARERELTELRTRLKSMEEYRPAPKPPLIKEPKPTVRTHTVKPGETLVTIAQRYYGDPNAWTKIYEANKDKLPTGVVTPGQVLIIP